MSRLDDRDAASSGSAPPSGSARPAFLRRHAPVLVLLLAYVAVVLGTFRDYGISWDETWYAQYGERMIEWYQSGLRDRASLERPIMAPNEQDPNMGNMSYAGGFFDLVAQSAVRLSPFGKFETRHLVGALFGVAGAAFAYLLGLFLAGPRAGFLAALFLIMTPPYFGHAFNNPKDIPFAVLYLAALYGIVRLAREFPAPPWRLVLGTGIAMGLTMAVRFGGVLLIGYLGLAALVWLAAARGRDFRRVSGRVAAAIAAGYATMLVFWPAAQLHPVSHPLRTLEAFSAYPWNYLVRFEGQDIRAPELPRYFVAKYALLTLPEFVLLGLVVALVLGLVTLVRRRPRIDATLFSYAIVLFACLFPLGYAALTHATVYDGLRHFLFVFPPLIVLSAIGIDGALRLSRPVALATAVLVVGGLGLTLREMIRLHPQEYIYFNQAIAGGLERAAGRYETDYWGNGLKEAAEWVAAHYQIQPGEEQIRVAACGNRLSTAYYLSARTFRVVPLDADPDLFLGMARFHCWDQRDGPVVHEVERVGVPLIVIKELTPAAAAHRRPPPLARRP